MLRRPHAPLAGAPARWSTAPLTALVAALALTACGGAEPAASGEPERGPGPTAAGPTEPGPTNAGPTDGGSPATEPAGARPSSTVRAPRTLVPIPPRSPLAKPSRSHLLPVDALPRVHAGLVWGRTTDEAVDGKRASGDPVGACQQASLVDIGALDSLHRTSVSEDGRTRVTQVVARFPDRTSTWRAHEVLRSWRSDCAERLGRRADVTAWEPVDVAVGHGEAYAAAYRSRDGRSHATGLGLVRKGSWLAVVEIATEPERWPTRRDPTATAVRRIGTTFER